jgi:Tfp pilus assembly protein PilO
VKRKLSPRALFIAVIGGVLVYALVFWFVLVSPKRAEASALKAEVAALEITVTNARLAATPRPNEDTKPIAVADIFRLAKAMPSAPDMAGILLELDRIAEDTGIEFQSVTPAASAVVGDYQTVPITLAFNGNFCSHGTGHCCAG